MGKIVIEIPENIARNAKIPFQDIEKRFAQELALRLYEKRILSFGKARELAGSTKWEFHRLLGKAQIERNYDLEELKSDIQTLEKLG